jgi:hypothetical protein
MQYDPRGRWAEEFRPVVHHLFWPPEQDTVFWQVLWQARTGKDQWRIHRQKKWREKFNASSPTSNPAAPDLLPDPTPSTKRGGGVGKAVGEGEF